MVDGLKKEGGLMIDLDKKNDTSEMTVVVLTLWAKVKSKSSATRLGLKLGDSIFHFSTVP